MSSIIAILSANTVSGTLRRLFLAWCCVALLCPALNATMRDTEEGEPEAHNAGEVLLDRWQVEAAHQWVSRQLAGDPDNPQWHFLLGQAEFYRGRYQEALRAFDRALAASPHLRIQNYRDFVAQTVASTASLQLLETDHFRIYLDVQRDAALVPYVGEALERSYQRLGEIFGWFPGDKIRVEIFPTPDTFYPATSLSARDIEVSGAIGICKFNKIMLLSPRNLARGYRWTDALSHEYIHFLLVHLSGNHAPIWLHEGIAKYFEDAWRLPQSAWLSRRTESLLAHALAHNTFVGFKNMEPSLVKLDTTYQVQLAYAEAASAIDFIIERLTATGLVRMLRDLQQSQDGSATGAIARVMGLEFEQFEAQWRAFLAAKQLREQEGIRLPSFQLKAEGRLEADELRQEIQSSTARMHARLGDRLRQRGRGSAAAEEYRRALRQDAYSPYLLNKLAAILMAREHWPEARQYLQQVQQLAPDYATTYTNLGRLHIALQEYEQARLALSEAVQINPFDPLIHLQLAESYRQLGMADRAQQEQHVFEQLQEKP